MSRPFQRGLSDVLLDDLMDGPCATVSRACVKAGLEVRLRANAVNLYFGGRSMARIVGLSRLPRKLEIHRKYVVEDQIGKFAGRPSWSYLVFDVNAGFVDAYVTELPAMMRMAGEHAGHEENVELRLPLRNDDTANVCCFDRQVQVPDTRRTLERPWGGSTRKTRVIEKAIKHIPLSVSDS